MAAKINRGRSRRLRRARLAFIGSWMQLLDMAERLEREFHRLPDGTLTHNETWAASDTLESMWYLLTNQRPHFTSDDEDAPICPTRIHPLTAAIMRRVAPKGGK